MTSSKHTLEAVSFELCLVLGFIWCLGMGAILSVMFEKYHGLLKKGVCN